MTEVNQTLPDAINPRNFPAKLWRMVNSPANRAICWDNSGESVVIDQQLFEKLVLFPRRNNNEGDADTFKTTHFSSFIRQLNLYGFKKINPVPEADICSFPEGKNTIQHHFFNPNFKQKHPEMLVNLKRLTVENKAKLKRGIEVRCRPPSKHQRVSFGREDTLEKCLMKGSPISDHMESPYLYLNRNLPLTAHSGIPVPSRYPPGGHSTPSSSVYPRDKGMHVSLGNPYSTVPSPFQQGAQCGVNYGPPNFTGIHPQNEQYHPGFYSSVYQCCRPPLMLIPNGVQTGHFSPGGYPACYSMISLDSDGQSIAVQNKNKPEMKKTDVNLDTIFQIADELMQTQPNNKLTKIVTPEKQPSSGTLSVSVQDILGIKKEKNTLCSGFQNATSSADTPIAPGSEVVSVPVQLPQDAISQDTSPTLL